MNNLEVPAVIFGCALLAYLMGSIPFGLILGKMYGMGDIRNIGSGNIGATNMLRTGNRNLAAATLILDMVKGFFAVLLCDLLLDYFVHGKNMSNGLRIDTGHILYFFGLCSVAGHVWPVWLNFKGGKGVATTIGVLLAAAPLIGLAVIISWIVIFYFTRYSSLSALISISLAPVLGYLFINADFGFMMLLLAIIVIAKHKSNIIRLLNGTETKWKKSHEHS